MATINGKRGIEALQDPSLNESTAFSEAEELALGPSSTEQFAQANRAPVPMPKSARTHECFTERVNRE